MEEKKITMLESKIHAMEELLKVSEISFLKESEKLETANRKLQQKIIEHEKLENDIKQILDASSDAIIVIDSEYNIIYASKALSNLRGIYTPDIVGRKCYETTPEKECFTENCALKKVLGTGKKFEKEIYIKNKYAVEIPYMVSVVPYNGPDGKSAGVIKSYRNIMEEEYRIFFESLRDAIILLGHDGFYACNKAALELFGFSTKEEFMSKHPIDISPPTQPDGRYSLTASAEHEGRAYREGAAFFEWLHRRQDGTTFPAEVFLCRIEYQSKIAIQATVRDITERKNAERERIKAQKIAEENAQQQGRIEMANNMLHDIGNAMTGISIYAFKPQLEKDWYEIKALSKLREMFVSKEKDFANILGREKQEALITFVDNLVSSFQDRNNIYTDFFEKISGTVGHITAVLDLQRHYVREKSNLLATSIDIKSVINDALIILSGSLQKRNIQVRLNGNRDVPHISGDHTRLIRVFMNIVKNIYEAFDASQSTDERKLDINIYPDTEEKKIVIVFSDNAIGFSPEIGSRLFERGFTTKYNGSGIGLHECRSIIESHGGTIAIESKGENTGAVTTIKFPSIITKHG